MPSTNSPSKDSDNPKTSTTTTATATTDAATLAKTLQIQFPTGSYARRELKKTLVQTSDPATTIETFQRTHSLHSMFAKSFETTPIYNLPSYSSAKNRSTTRATTNAKAAEEEGGVVAESFDPEPVLSFLTQLG
eukprot:8014515-Ditylum_brightwellii.AAC.1